MYAETRPHPCRAKSALLADKEQMAVRYLPCGAATRTGVRVTIAIVGGTGPEGSGLALRWARAGETVIIGSRDPKRASQTANRIPEKTGGSLSGADTNIACPPSQILLPTPPFSPPTETLT